MELTKTSNPVLKTKAFDISAEGKTMTVSGAVNKSFILFFIILASGIFSWKFALSNLEYASSLVLPAVIIGFVLALVTIFAKKYSAITAPIYAVAEGFALGIISLVYSYVYNGIVLQAILLTLGILGVMLLAYKFGMIKPTAKFKSGVIMATGGIAVVYILTWILSFFGITVPFIHEGGIIGIGISLFIVVIASLNLILDFSFFEEAAESNSPKYMEWYAAFGLMVTLVWLYLEVLRLLGKIRN
jgi:uncharacterized YccA/Bax inhibitor family protein